MRGFRLVLSALVLAAICGLLYTYYAYASPPHKDDNFHVKSSLVSPSSFDTETDYEYAIDHPALKRYIYGAVLRANGVTSLDIGDVDYRRTYEWNWAHGRLVRSEITLPLRFTNVAFMTGAVFLFFFAAFLILDNAYLALLVVAPIVLSSRICWGVVGYVGCDAILAFTVAAALFAWVALAKAGRAAGLAGVLVVGALAGLAASAKFNGGLVAVAYCIYLVFANRGTDRVVRPALAALVALAVFVMLNPVMRGGGLEWVYSVVGDMLARRRHFVEVQYDYNPLPRTQLVARYFPYAAFVYAIAAGWVVFRRERWAAPVGIFAAVLTLGTVLTVSLPVPRYFMPVELGTFFAGGAFGWALLRRAALSRRPQTSAHLSRNASSAAVALAAILVMLTFAAAFEPWLSRGGFAGPSVHQVRQFYKGALGYFGLKETKRSESTAETPATPLAAQVTPGTAALASGAAFAAGCLVVYHIGRLALGNGWLGAMLLLPLLWAEFATMGFWRQSASERYFFLFTAAALYVLVRLARREKPSGWLDVAVLSTLSGFAAASSPKGIVLAAASVVVAARGARGRRGIIMAAGSVGTSIAAYAVFSPDLWRLGARAQYEFVSGVMSEGFSHWGTAFARLDDILAPLWEHVPYWPLLPLAAAALLAVRKAPWAGALALWSGCILGGTILTMPASAAGMPLDVNLVLTLGAGLPALALLARSVRVEASLADAV